MRLLEKIERLQKQSREIAKTLKPHCPHAYTLKMFGEVISDPPPCACRGQRITIAVVYTKGN